MTEENKEFETWEDVIVDFFEHKVENIQNSNPKIPCKIYKAREYIRDKEKSIKSEKDNKKIEKLIKDKEKKQSELNQLRLEAPSTEIRHWIDKASQTKIAEGKRIVKATHVLRFTHSSSQSDGLILEEKSNDVMLTTSSTKKTLTYDIAHNNGALITISRFLALKLSGKLIIDLILDGDFLFFKPFSENQEQFDKWCTSFTQLVEKRKNKTTDKVKQIYFPLEVTNSNKKKYHLIAPLFSSSLYEEIFYVVNNLKFGDENKIAKAKNESSKYYSKNYIELPNLGIQQFGGKQPQNVSMLNKNRAGKCYLFSCQPPTWETQLKPPINYQSFFYAVFLYAHTRETINYLRDFLLRYQVIDLSIKDPERRKWINRWVNDIIDDILLYVADIQNLQPGWSDREDIKLKSAHQYFLDPYRDDEAFQTARNNNDWQTVICRDFAHWLNHKLIGKDKKFTPQQTHTRIWRELFEQPLREYNDMIEINAQFKEEA